jgi:hypothetical protein
MYTHTSQNLVIDGAHHMATTALYGATERSKASLARNRNTAPDAQTLSHAQRHGFSPSGQATINPRQPPTQAEDPRWQLVDHPARAASAASATLGDLSQMALGGGRERTCVYAYAYRVRVVKAKQSDAKQGKARRKQTAKATTQKQ